MQFSVIVGAPANKISATEDAVAELERYLLSAHISPKVLEGIEPGKPHILKKELSYEQAVDLSDRLMDFGLESEIHPPTKPEAVRAENKTKKPTVSQNGNSNNPSDILKTKTPINTAQQKAINNQNRDIHNKAKDTITKKTTPPQAASVATTKSTYSQPNKKIERSTLKEQAEEIKSLFRIKKTNISNIEISGLDVLRSYTTALLSIALPTIYILGTIALAAAGVLSAVILHKVIAGFSIILSFTSIIIVSIPLLVLACLLSIPFFTKSKISSKKMALTAKDEPRLFMLTAATCKIIGAPTPEKIMISLEGDFHGSFSYPKNTLFKLNKPLEGRPSLTVCASLLNSLSIRQYCSLVSRELGKQQYSKFRRPDAISNIQLNRLKKIKEKPKSTSAFFSSISNKIPNHKIKGYFESFSSLAETMEYLHETYFNFSHQLISRRLKNDSISKRFQCNVLGAESEIPLKQLAAKLEHLSASRHETIETMTKENESHRYAASLPDLIEHLEDKHNTDKGFKVIDDSLIPKDTRLKTILDNFSKCSALLTKDFYSSHGINLEQAQLLSIDNLLKKESRDAKIEKIASEYFGKWHHGLQVWKLPKEAVLASVDKKHIVAALNNSINKLRYLSPDRSALIEKYYRQLKQLTELRAAKKIRSTGVEYKLTSVPDNTINLDTEITSRETQLHDINTELTQQNSAMGERIALGLLLDEDHQQMTKKLFSALSAISDCASELNNIAADCEELQTLINNTPKRINQHFNLQLKKVKDRIDNDYKILNRKLKKCPFDFIDQRHDSVFSLLNNKVNNTIYSTDENKRTLQKGKVTLTVIATSYKSISDLAANYATRMERLYKIQAIRKL